ncbi:MAG: hypothetical protein KFW21_03510 [Spirochaetota bacterium]|nr:hypothetical protein [Spirochaetota bacterium]
MKFLALLAFLAINTGTFASTEKKGTEEHMTNEKKENICKFQARFGSNFR